MQTAQHWVLPQRPTSPCDARRHLRSYSSELSRDLLEIALLLTSELVTNAVKYGGQRIVLVVTNEADAFRVEVQDDSPRVPRPRTAGPGATGGRGLLLLEKLAHQWGTAPRGAGKVVWFTLRKVL